MDIKDAWAVAKQCGCARIRRASWPDEMADVGASDRVSYKDYWAEDWQPVGVAVRDVRALTGEYERSLFEWAYQQAGGNCATAARLLKLGRTTFHERAKKLGIHVPVHMTRHNDPEPDHQG